MNRNRLPAGDCARHGRRVGDDRIHDERLEIGDAFGEVLRACHRGGEVSGVAFELIERSDGYLGITDAARYFVAPSDWAATSRFASGRAQGRILDIGAGAGRVSLALQQAGLDVVALDISEGAIEVCKERGVRSVFKGTIFDLAATRSARFDTFLMLGNNLGLLGGPEEAPLLLEALAAMAAPGARVIGETLNPYQTNDPRHLEYHEENRRLGRLGGQLRLRIRHLGTATPWWDYLFCTPEELETVIAPTRWELVDAHAPSPDPREDSVHRSWPPGQWAATLQLGP
jgi:2-polyprenyl-3-methyl-5-hydroxy-6-metoxy-1,4-benzoquinol methylase